MKIAKTTLSRIWRLGRGTATVMGLAVILALTVGLATTALGAVPGDPFKLGRLNAVNAVTRLAGKSTGPMLRVDNNSSAANARALDLRVEQGRAPSSLSTPRRARPPTSTPTGSTARIRAPSSPVRPTR